MLTLKRFAVSMLIGLSYGQVWPTQSYKTENFLPPDLAINKTGPTDPGYLFFGPVGNGTLSQAPLIMTDTNELVWQGPGGVPQNVRVQELDGTRVLTFWSGYGAVVTTFGHGYGHIAILDDTYKVAYNICMSHLNLVTPNATLYPGTDKRPCYLDNHESFITKKGTIIATAFNVTQYDLSPVGGPTNGWIFDALFYEIDIKTQKVLFKWSALENIPITQSNYVNRTGPLSTYLSIGGVTYGNSQALPWDFFHINSVQPIEGGYLVNSRYTWSMYKVDGKSGKVDWRLEGSNGGDFTLGPDIFFSWQHMPRMAQVTASSYEIHLFDNDNVSFLANGTNATSGLLLSVNDASKKVTLLRKLLDPAEQFYSVAQGSYWSLPNDHVLIGYGTYPVIKEYDGSGNRNLRVQFGNYFGYTKVVGYRAYRQHWKAQPHYPPKVYGEVSGNATTVYMSWNGATDYNKWTIYAGNSKKKLKPVATTKKAGFETMYQLDQSWTYVQVEAYHNKQLLSRSKATPTVQGDN